MSIVRWTPGYRPATRNRAYDTDPFFGAFENFFRTPSLTDMSVDVEERENEYVLRAELPGVKREDLNVNVENDVLTIEAEKREERDEKETGYYHTERRFGKFSRSFKLNGQVDADKVDADYSDGVLQLSLPKKEEVKPRKVEVKVK